MRINEITPILKSAIENKLNVLLVGPPGVGKTDILKQTAKQLDYDLIISHPAVEDPTVPGGLPWPVAEKSMAMFLPFGALARAIHANKHTIWFLDDLGQASPAVQASYMQLLHGGQVGEHTISPFVSFVAATNRREDRAGVSGLLEPVKSRFGLILNLNVHIDDWKLWAHQNEIRSEILGYLGYAPQYLLDFKATADLIQSPSPRTWTFASKIMDLELPEVLKEEALAGAIGPAAATDFCSFIKLASEMPHPLAVIKDPLEAAIPKNQAALWALSEALVAHSKPENFGAILAYADRLFKMKGKEGRADFYFVIVQGLSGKHGEKFRNSPVFHKELDNMDKAMLLLDSTQLDTTKGKAS